MPSKPEALIANCDTIDTNRPVDLGLAGPIMNYEKYNGTAVVKHWNKALARES